MQLIINQDVNGRSEHNNQAEPSYEDPPLINGGPIPPTIDGASYTNIPTETRKICNSTIGSFFQFHGAPKSSTPCMVGIPSLPVFFARENDAFTPPVERRGYVPRLEIQNGSPRFIFEGVDGIGTIAPNSSLGRRISSVFRQELTTIKSTIQVARRGNLLFSLSKVHMDKPIIRQMTCLAFSKTAFSSISLLSIGRLSHEEDKIVEINVFSYSLISALK